MQYITTTQLRTMSVDLVKTLCEGQEVLLLHRSKPIGNISPQTGGKIIDSKRLEAKIAKLGLPSLTPKEIDRRYRAAMMKKHGQGFSRH